MESHEAPCGAFLFIYMIIQKTASDKAETDFL